MSNLSPIAPVYIVATINVFGMQDTINEHYEQGYDLITFQFSNGLAYLIFKRRDAKYQVSTEEKSNVKLLIERME